MQDGVSETFFEPVIRLGVTGLARSGKTVFITSLVANLLDRGRMPGLLAASEGRIEAAFLQPQPDDTVPRFEYENHLAALTGPTPHWPDSTRAISELRLSLRVRPNGLLAGFQGPRTVHLDIVDYPGEWLLDLALMDVDYATWSGQVLARIANREEAAGYRALVEGTDPEAALDEPVVQALAASFAISAALYGRATSGRGSFIDVSMLETGLSLMSSTVTDYLKTGNEPQRRGNLANSRSPGAGSFACSEGVVSLGVNEESHFRNLAGALGRGDWLTDPRFAERAARKAHAGELVAEIEAKLAQKPATEWEAVLQQAGVPAARIRTLHECLASDQVRQRQFVHTDPASGVATPTLPFRIAGAASHAPGKPAPRLGEDTAEIMAWLEGGS